MTLSAGTRLGPYEILSPLGAGGMGEVYRARDPRLGREVAIKVLPAHLASDPEALARFEREAKAVATLSHSNILAIHDFGKHGDIAYAVTELLEGKTLRGRLDADPLSQNEILSYAQQVVRGLSAAHDKGIVHRDLKPENIFITSDGQVKILDFGLVKRIITVPEGEETSAPTVTGQTTPGTVMGTLSYMSPEQVKGLPVDHRSDLFSFGAVLYEMVTRERAFRGNSAVAVADAILHAQPRRLAESRVPGKLRATIRRLLEKEPEKRYATAAEVRSDLKAAEAHLAPGSRELTPRARLAIVAVAVALAAVGGWLWHRASRQRWALAVAAPEIKRLVEEGKYFEAATLAQEARSVLPTDPTLEKLWLRAAGECSIESTPSGADVSIRLYRGDPNAWQTLGKTPLRNIRVPNDYFVWRISKPGFATLLRIASSDDMSARLSPEKDVPPEMVAVSGGEVGLTEPVPLAPRLRLDDYYIDRHEVTNEEYQNFVNASGYQRREFWKQPFVKEGRVLTWDEAIPLFRDTTGRPGPSTWEVGLYPKGLGRHPVAGISWYEAAAYAEFVGKSLPSAYHWAYASQGYFAALIVPGSNFRFSATQPVGSAGTLSGFGTTDMAGNVKEWCWNESGSGKRFILGGGIGEPVYMFQEGDAQSPWERRPNYGVRCARFPSAPSPEAFAKIDSAVRDYSTAKPVSDDVFAIFKGLHAYDGTELNAKIEEREATSDWTREKISFDAPYGGERVAAHLFLPKGIKPPYQTVVYFPGVEAMATEKFSASLVSQDAEDIDFLIKSGRALLFPIYKGTYDRRDGYSWHSVLRTPTLWRDHLIMWSKDLSRSLDYLQTRTDIDATRLAYVGFSWGSAVSPVLIAVHQQFKAAILKSGGLYMWSNSPEADPINFVTHVQIPVLMLNDQYDNFFPPEPSQIPFFRFLGTPGKDKRRVVYDSGHGGLPRHDWVRESLDWLDRYLGPVKR